MKVTSLTIPSQFVLITILSTIVVCDKRNLKQLHIFFRHGARSPTDTYPNDPHANYTWPGTDGRGQLTNVGKLQMFALGQKLRQTYEDFIPEYYYKNEVNVMSSYADRCLMSAECLLAGLYPPRGEQIWNDRLLWQPIPVSYLPRSQDNLIAMKSKCRKYDQQFKKNLQSEDIRKYEEDNKDLFEYVSQQSGDNVHNIAKAEQLYNTLEVQVMTNLTMPSWVNSHVLSRLKEMASRYLAAFTETDYMKRVKGGVFVNRTISTMKNDNRTLVHLYAGHDVSLVNILRPLGIVKTIKPGLGAYLVMELYDNNIVQIFYRNDAESDQDYRPPMCKTECTLTQLEEFYKPLLPNKWNEECLN